MAQGAASTATSSPAGVTALADSLRAYRRVDRTSEGDTTATTQTMTSHDGCKVVLTFEETGEGWQVIREARTDLGLLQPQVTVDRELEERDIENVEDTLDFPWRLEVHTKGGKDVEVRRTDIKNGKPDATVATASDRLEFLVPTEAGVNGVSKALTIAIAACGAMGGT